MGEFVSRGAHERPMREFTKPDGATMARIQSMRIAMIECGYPV
jgi:hypothetical protein